jgi:hypothetical protein
VGRGKRRRANTKPIVIPGVGVRRSAQHPGTKGKYPWRKGNEAAEPKVREVLTSKTATVIRRNF